MTFCWAHSFATLTETWIVCRLEKSDKKANNVDLLVSCDPGSAERHDGPAKLQDEHNTEHV